MFLLKELLQGLLVRMEHILSRDLQVQILSGLEAVIAHQAFGIPAVWRWGGGWRRFNPWCGGAGSQAIVGEGINANGHGGGGGGACVYGGATQQRAGGSGMAGIAIIWEYA